jgi:UV DNA damage endonuclease
LISKRIGIPIVFDNYHHECLNDGTGMRYAILQSMKTWKKKDGKLMVDYSSQGSKKGAHAEHIEMKLFDQFIRETNGLDFDIMLEIKDKEKSALKAIKFLKSIKRNF